jgi:ribose 1,5-bisphosphokinase PhnN
VGRNEIARPLGPGSEEVAMPTAEELIEMAEEEERMKFRRHELQYQTASRLSLNGKEGDPVCHEVMRMNISRI